jgi:SAM-dependent methyltransferase
MYDLLSDVSRRPEPFSRYTVKDLWTRPHLAQQMLAFHLSQETDLASRTYESIDRAVQWIDTQLGLSGKSLCDLGCGPGLYAQRFESKGAIVTGVDFSEVSIDYANTQGPGTIVYVNADYLVDDLPTGFDVVTLIYTDLCALSPEQRQLLLGRMRGMLNPRGRIVLDVAGPGSFNQKQEATIVEERLMDGFWAPGPYVGIQRTFIYAEQHVSLDRYVIVEPGEIWQIFNWFQYFSPETIEAELQAAGFAVDQMVGDLTGATLKPTADFLGIVARAA